MSATRAETGEYLWGFAVTVTGDGEFQIHCNRCFRKLYDIEAGDPLYVLADGARGHRCAEDDFTAEELELLLSGRCPVSIDPGPWTVRLCAADIPEESGSVYCDTHEQQAQATAARWMPDLRERTSRHIYAIEFDRYRDAGRP